MLFIPSYFDRALLPLDCNLNNSKYQFNIVNICSTYIPSNSKSDCYKVTLPFEVCTTKY